MSLDANAFEQTVSSKTRGMVTSRMYVANRSKAILDDVDQVFAHYLMTEEQLDFILNYDIKFRMGTGNDGADD